MVYNMTKNKKLPQILKNACQTFRWGRMDGQQATMWINKLLAYKYLSDPQITKINLDENVKLAS